MASISTLITYFTEIFIVVTYSLFWLCNSIQSVIIISKYAKPQLHNHRNSTCSVWIYLHYTPIPNPDDHKKTSHMIIFHLDIAIRPFSSSPFTKNSTKNTTVSLTVLLKANKRTQFELTH